MVVKGNPAAKITDIEKVEIVFKDGVGYDSEKLIQSVPGSGGDQVDGLFGDRGQWERGRWDRGRPAASGANTGSAGVPPALIANTGSAGVPPASTLNDSRLGRGPAPALVFASNFCGSQPFLKLHHKLTHHIQRKPRQQCVCSTPQIHPYNCSVRDTRLLWKLLRWCKHPQYAAQRSRVYQT